MQRFAYSLMMLAALVGGCKQQEGEVDGSEAKIFGGEPVREGDPIEVFTAALTKPNGAVICTATLVSPTVLVTAAHCLTTDTLSGGLNVTFGLETKQGSSVPIKAYAVHPRYDPALAGSETRSQYDLGLVAIPSPAPGRNPVPILNSEFPLEPYASTLRIAGYGFTDLGQNDIGVLRSAATNFSAESTPTKEIFIDGFRVTNACSGDSGGPALIRYSGQYYVLGAASYVIKVNGRVCNSGYSAYTDLRAHRDWIDQMIQKLPDQKGKVESKAPQLVQGSSESPDSASREIQTVSAGDDAESEAKATPSGASVPEQAANSEATSSAVAQ